jgi:hypothetical protein
MLIVTVVTTVHPDYFITDFFDGGHVRLVNLTVKSIRSVVEALTTTDRAWADLRNTIEDWSID